ncbi:hypothetical protein GCM10027299_23480 [Larkinella ripae]
MLRFILLIALSTMLFIGCSTSEKKDPLLEEAARFHHEATQIQAAVEPKIEQIDSLKTALGGRPDPTAAAIGNTLDSLKKAYEHWEENLVEVPGMPHEHHHGEHAHHHPADATLKDLPPGQMRDLQRETRDNIRQIQERTEAAFAQATTLRN